MGCTRKMVVERRLDNGWKVVEPPQPRDKWCTNLMHDLADLKSLGPASELRITVWMGE